VSARSGIGRSASQAVKGGEGLELAELLVQIGRGRADDEAVDALGGVGLRTDLLRRESTRKEAFATSAGAGSGERTPGARVPKPGAGSGARPYRR